MMKRLEEAKEMEAFEKMKLEEEIRAKQEEVQRIADEVQRKDDETRRLQTEVEEARRRQEEAAAALIAATTTPQHQHVNEGDQVRHVFHFTLKHNKPPHPVLSWRLTWHFAPLLL